MDEAMIKVKAARMKEQIVELSDEEYADLLAKFSPMTLERPFKAYFDPKRAKA